MRYVSSQMQSGYFAQFKAQPLQQALILTFLLWLTPVLLLAATGRTLHALVLAPLPLVLLLCASPRTCFYLFMLTVPIYYPYRVGAMAIWSFDLLMALLLFGLVIEFLLRADTDIRPTGLDIPFLALIGATWLSAFFAYNTGETIVPSVRILVIYLAFRAIFSMTLKLGVRKVVVFYIGLVAVLSLINLALFVKSGGAERVFGPAWLAFECYSMTALPMALAFFIWSRRFTERFIYGSAILVILLAIAASGSRGALVAVALSVPVLLLLAYHKIRRERQTESRRTLRKVVIVGAAVTVVVFALGSSFFLGFFGRVEELVASIGNPQGTIYLRLVLWTAAVKAWLTSPLVGIGIGNFNLVDQIVPSIKTAPVWYYIRGMSAHNVVLHYLAETGIIGVVALLLLTFTGLRQGLRVFREKLSQADTQVSAAVMIAMVVFAMSIFFMRAWTWAQEGNILAMIFGMTAAWYYQLRSKKTPTA